ncbi:MAG: zinc-dependent metalloprotease [Bdellovibrio sp.]
MQNLNPKTMRLGSLMFMCALVISCTKEVPYKQVYKGTGSAAVQEKKKIDMNAEYLYVASSDLSNQDSTGASGASPYWQGQEKIIKFKFTENALQVLAVNEEARLKDNQTNDKILMEIPVSHVDYQCTLDRYNNCTNQESENNDIAWDKKNNFKPDFNGMKTVGFSLLPVEMDQVFGTSCFTEVNSQFLSYDLSETSLNIQVQKTFKADLACVERKGLMVSSLEDMQTQIIYHYSFTKLNSIASPNYQPVVYPAMDEDAFGFFTSQNRKYDVDFSHSEASKFNYMNRWNPEKKEIVYYLSDNFNKPEFKEIKEATYQAFAKVNNGLEAAGLENRLILKEPEHKVPGDVRNSMIVLVEDPIAGGPLGYGPTAANPRTGEILSGRVALYYGNYMQNIRYVYDEVVRELRNRKQQEKQASQDASKPATESNTDNAKIQLSAQLKYQTKLASFMQNVTAGKLVKTVKNKSLQSKEVNTVSRQKAAFAKNSLSKASLPLSKLNAKNTLVSDQKSTARDRLSAMSKYCNYPAELFPFNEILKNTLQSKLGTELKLWNDLSSEERKTVMAIIMPEVWLPTLVHELGHNMGLRHNFAGSEDKANFYTQEELNKMGVKHEIPYSSVMDYGYSELNLLPTLGKYDIAALRFGYKREVDTKDGKTLTVKTTLKDLANDLKKSSQKNQDDEDSENFEPPFKRYSYCSDEHVEVNPNCKRFDKGTNLVEIVDYLIKSYDEMYTTRNFRNGRENFSKARDGAYYGFIWDQFMYIRAFMERYESIKADAHVSDDDKAWQTNPFLKQLKEAAIKSGQFFIKVLQTPDTMCAIASKDKPEEILGFQRLETISTDALSCFGLKLIDNKIVVGQLGKFFNDKKDPKSDNHYADQIDVRGIWPDKVAAARALLYRQIGNTLFDEHEDNYGDISELSEDVTKNLGAMLLGNVTTQVPMFDQNGQQTATAEVNVSFFNPPETFKEIIPTHWINAPFDENVAKLVGIPMQQVSIQQILLDTIAESVRSSQSHKFEGDTLLTKFAVTKTSPVYQLKSTDDIDYKDISGTRFVAFKDNSLARTLISFSKSVNLLDKLSDKELDELIAEKQKAEDEAIKNGQGDQGGQAVAADNGGEQTPQPQQPSQAEAPKSNYPAYSEIPLYFINAYKKGIVLSEQGYDYLIGLLPDTRQK